MNRADLSTTIERIYAAGAGSEPWRAALESIYTLLGATGGGIVRTAADGTRRIEASALADDGIS